MTPFDGSGGGREDQRVVVKKPGSRKPDSVPVAAARQRPKLSKRQSAALKFGELASRWQIIANRRSEDPAARELTAILWALKAAYAKQDPWLDGVARKARAYLKKHNTGPRERPAEANQLASHLGTNIKSGLPVGEIAKRLLHRLHALPELCGETVVPISGAWPDAEQANAEALVTRALKPLLYTGQKDPELWAKAALKALGHRSTKNMFAHRKA